MGRETLVDHARNAVVAAAASGRLMPGERIVETTLARELGISRIPVREALRLLESQGLIENQPYRGARLMSVNRTDVEELVPLHETLELLALREGTQRLRAEASERELRRALEIGHAAVAGNDQALMVEADRRFHQAIWRACGNQVLFEQLDHLLDRQHIIWGCMSQTGRLESCQAEHVALVQHIVAGEAAATERLLRAHLRWFLRPGVIEIVEWRSRVARF